MHSNRISLRQEPQDCYCFDYQRHVPPLNRPKHHDLSGDFAMKLSNPEFLAVACLVTMLATPAAVVARNRALDNGGDKNKDTKTTAVPEPSTLVMTLAGVGIGLGLLVAGMRRKSATNAA
jgi:hypothetical protein